MSRAYGLCLLLLAQIHDRQQRYFGTSDRCQANQNKDTGIQHEFYKNETKYNIST